jgi:hypothetical protein
VHTCAEGQRADFETLRQTFEDWLLSMPWTPELQPAQKAEIADCYAKAFALDWLAGKFMGEVMPAEERLPQLWRDVAAGLTGGLLSGLPAGIADMYAEFFAKRLVGEEIVGQRPPALVKTVYDAEEEMSRNEAAALVAKIHQAMPGGSYADGYVQVSAPRFGEGARMPMIAVRHLGLERRGGGGG